MSDSPRRRARTALTGTFFVLLITLVYLFVLTRGGTL
jgi:hypothetical protein